MSEGVPTLSLGEVIAYGVYAYLRKPIHLGELELLLYRLSEYTVSIRAERSFQSAQFDENQERNLILNALEETRWNRRQTAQNLDMSYGKLRYRMLKLDIK